MFHVLFEQKQQPVWVSAYFFFLLFDGIVEELNITNFSQSIDPLLSQKSLPNSMVNLLIICEYDLRKVSVVFG